MMVGLLIRVLLMRCPKLVLLIKANFLVREFYPLVHERPKPRLIQDLEAYPCTFVGQRDSKTECSFLIDIQKDNGTFHGDSNLF
jgi:hypothetical protein